MTLHQPQHRGRIGRQAQDARGFRYDRYESYRRGSSYASSSSSYGSRDSYRPVSGRTPHGIRKQRDWKQPRHIVRLYTESKHRKTPDQTSELEEGEASPEPRSSSEEYCRSLSLTSDSLPSDSSAGSHDELPYSELLRKVADVRAKLSDRLFNAEVAADRHRRDNHAGNDSAYQFDMRQPYVLDMLRHMHEKYDTVTVYSLAMLEPGDIIYYLEAFPLGLHQNDQGYYVAEVGGPRCTARMKMKGRFGIVVDVFGQHVKVVGMTTFSHEGLARGRPQRFWPEYVGIRETSNKKYLNPSPNRPLEVGLSCCEIHSETSVHLVTDKVSLSNHIMVAGNITSDSLTRLRAMIKKVESGASR